MKLLTAFLHQIRAVAGNDRAVANARRLLDKRRFEDRLVAGLAHRVAGEPRRQAA